MPKVKKGEKKSDFIKRCIPIVLNEGTASSNKQAAAICFSMWREHKKKSKGDISDETIRTIAREIKRQQELGDLIKKI